jgi:hypothetical protein
MTMFMQDFFQMTKYTRTKIHKKITTAHNNAGRFNCLRQPGQPDNQPQSL